MALNPFAPIVRRITRRQAPPAGVVPPPPPAVPAQLPVPATGISTSLASAPAGLPVPVMEDRNGFTMFPEAAFPDAFGDGLVEHVIGSRRVYVRPFRSLRHDGIEDFGGGFLDLPDDTLGVLAVRWSDKALVTVAWGADEYDPSHHHLIGFKTMGGGLERWFPLVRPRPDADPAANNPGWPEHVWIAPLPGTKPGGGTNDDPFNSEAPGFDVDALLQDARYRVYHFAPGTYPLTGGYNLKPNIEVHGAGSALTTFVLAATNPTSGGKYYAFRSDATPNGTRNRAKFTRFTVDLSALPVDGRGRHGIVALGDDLLVEDVIVAGCYGDSVGNSEGFAIYLSSFVGGIATNPPRSEAELPNFIRECHVKGCPAQATLVNGQPYTHVTAFTCFSRFSTGGIFDSQARQEVAEPFGRIGFVSNGEIARAHVERYLQDTATPPLSPIRRRVHVVNTAPPGALYEDGTEANPCVVATADEFTALWVREHQANAADTTYHFGPGTYEVRAFDPLLGPFFWTQLRSSCSLIGAGPGLTIFKLVAFSQPGPGNLKFEVFRAGGQGGSGQRDIHIEGVTFDANADVLYATPANREFAFGGASMFCAYRGSFKNCEHLHAAGHNLTPAGFPPLPFGLEIFPFIIQGQANDPTLPVQGGHRITNCVVRELRRNPASTDPAGTTYVTAFYPSQIGTVLEASVIENCIALGTDTVAGHAAYSSNLLTTIRGCTGRGYAHMFYVDTGPLSDVVVENCTFQFFNIVTALYIQADDSPIRMFRMRDCRASLVAGPYAVVTPQVLLCAPVPSAAVFPNAGFRDIYHEGCRFDIAAGVTPPASIVVNVFYADAHNVRFNHCVFDPRVILRTPNAVLPAGRLSFFDCRNPDTTPHALNTAISYRNLPTVAGGPPGESLVSGVSGVYGNPAALADNTWYRLVEVRGNRTQFQIRLQAGDCNVQATVMVDLGIGVITGWQSRGFNNGHRIRVLRLVSDTTLGTGSNTRLYLEAQTGRLGSLNAANGVLCAITRGPDTNSADALLLWSAWAVAPATGGTVAVFNEVLLNADAAEANSGQDWPMFFQSGLHGTSVGALDNAFTVTPNNNGPRLGWGQKTAGRIRVTGDTVAATLGVEIAGTNRGHFGVNGRTLGTPAVARIVRVQPTPNLTAGQTTLVVTHNLNISDIVGVVLNQNGPPWLRVTPLNVAITDANTVTLTLPAGLAGGGYHTIVIG